MTETRTRDGNVFGLVIGFCAYGKCKKRCNEIVRERPAPPFSWVRYPNPQVKIMFAKGAAVPIVIAIRAGLK